MNVAVQVISKSKVDFAFSKQLRRAIGDSVAPDLSVAWLPPQVRDRTDAEGCGLSWESVVLVVLLGVGLNTIVKSFVESMAKEAGKDAWGALKRLVAGLWGEQARNSYNLKSKAFIIAELEEDFAAIELQLPSLPSEDEKREAAIRDCIETQIAELEAEWADIQKNLDKFGVGKALSSQIHVVSRRGKWKVRPIETTEFVSEARIIRGLL